MPGLPHSCTSVMDEPFSAAASVRMPLAPILLLATPMLKDVEKT